MALNKETAKKIHLGAGGCREAGIMGRGLVGDNGGSAGSG